MIQSQIEIGPSVSETFYGSDVEKLSLVQDAAWLELITPAQTEVTDAYIQQLNEVVDIVSGGPALDGVLESEWQAYLAHPSRNKGFGPGKPLRLHFMHRAKSQFLDLLGANSPESPISEVKKYLVTTTPSNIVANLRLIHQYVADALPTVISTSGNVFTCANATLLRKVDTVEADGLSAASIFLHNANVFVRQDAGEASQQFLARARVAGTSRQSLANKAAKLKRRQVEVKVGAAEELAAEISERHIALAGLTLIRPELLAAVLPQLGRLDEDQMDELTDRVDRLFETKDDIRVRDLSRLLGEIDIDVK